QLGGSRDLPQSLLVVLRIHSEAEEIGVHEVQGGIEERRNRPVSVPGALQHRRELLVVLGLRQVVLPGRHSAPRQRRNKVLAPVGSTERCDCEGNSVRLTRRKPMSTSGPSCSAWSPAR